MKKYYLVLTICLLIIPVAVKSNPGSFFPRIKGWETDISKDVYDPFTLWEYINGAADIYLSYDFQNLFLAGYANDEGQTVNVEIYRHSTVENAFGIYTAERMTDYSFINIGVQGYYEPGVLNFLSGQYYVKMSSSGLSVADKEAFLEIAGAINTALDTENKWPLVLDLFPAEGKLSNTESYIARNFIGYSAFHSAFTAEYNMQEKFKMFIIKLNSESEVRTMLENYTAMLNENKITEEGNTYIIEDLFNGMIYISINSNYMIGIINTSNKDLAIRYIEKTVQQMK